MASIEYEIDYEDDESFVMDDDENIVMAPAKKTTSKSKAASKKKPVLSARNENAVNIEAEAPDNGSKKTKTIEERYQKKTQLEHILLRPDTYIGSDKPTEDKAFIYDTVQDAIVEKVITYTPGLYKIFDESKNVVCFFPRKTTVEQ